MSTREHPPNEIRRIRLYECDSFEARVLAQSELERAGALIQDFKFDYESRSAVFRYTLNVSFSEFVERLEAPGYWESTEIEHLLLKQKG